VTVNGSVVSELGAKADLSETTSRLDGERVQAQRARVILLHKPDGVRHHAVRSRGAADDPRLAAAGLRAGLSRRPAGLPFERLLLLTNEGDLAARLLHRRYRIARAYRVKVSGHPSAAHSRAGVMA